MKKILILTLILLTACTTPASYSNDLSAPVILTADSTSEQIQRALLESAARWQTIQMDGSVTWYAADGTPAQTYQEQVWVDPLGSRYKVTMNEVSNSAEKFLKFSDGENVYNINLNSGQVETLSYPDFARVGQFVPPLIEGDRKSVV